MFLIYNINERVWNYFKLRFCIGKSVTVKETNGEKELKSCTYNIAVNLFEGLKTLQITAACGSAVIFCVFRRAWSNMTISIALKSSEKALGVIVTHSVHASAPE